MSDGAFATLRRRFAQDSLFWLCAITVIVFIPMLLLYAITVVRTERQREADRRDEIYQTYERRFQMLRVVAMVQAAESSQRGYLLTGQPEFLRSKVAVEKTINGDLDRLQKLSATEPDQMARVQRFRDLVATKFTEMNEVSGLRDRNGLETAAQRVGERRGEDMMIKIRAVARDMIRVEADQLAHKLTVGTEQISYARRAVFTTLALVLAAIIAASVMAFRYTHLRTRLILRARAEAQRRQAIFDSAMDAIVTLNPSGGLESINQAGERMFGYAEADLVGRDISVLVPLAPGEEGLFLDRLQSAKRLLDGKACEFEARRADGTNFPVDVNIGEMTQPDGPHIVAVMRDCTERKRADQAKDEFVSTVSHELRTPLTSIAGSLGLLIGGAAGPLPERANRLVTIAEANSRRLVRLINDILDIEKIQSGKMTFSLRRMDAAELIRRTIDAMGGVAADYDVVFDYSGPKDGFYVQGDPDRLTQVFTNLMSNAAKFSPPGAKVEVSAVIEGARGRISVRDHGQGVPAEFRDRIFGKFAQADASDTRQKGGTGLGLAITKEIVERHGGRIWFESPPGKGATFFVELPLAASREAPLDSATGPRLLLCEDDLDVSRVLSEALTMQGFQVVAVHTLAATEAALAEDGGGFAALLLDLRLPDGSGLDLLPRLREQVETRDLPVIVISADSRTEGASSFDLVDWIEKPVDLKRLQASLDQAVHKDDGPPLVMHVDDDPDLRQLVQTAFAGRCRLVAAESLATARLLLTTMTPQLVILDVGLPDGSGLDLLPELVDSNGRALPVVIFSAQSLERSALTDAVDAVLTKSRTSLEQLIRTVQRLSRTYDRRGAMEGE
jgi:PAS domain S-box-containing protein